MLIKRPINEQVRLGFFFVPEGTAFVDKYRCGLCCRLQYVETNEAI